ncbi:hypothetical protein K9M79_00630 [Candidatus Woesearchaeota archaeon]|nr:hypothetical protein [Candidatus Woesearchaeota archaeon]
MGRKERCKELMAKYFGPATAQLVDTMTEEDCVDKCKQRVSAFLGEDAAKEFDEI